MPSPPSGIDATTLATAKGDQLRFWIDEVNGSTESTKKSKKVLTKSGKVDELRRKLAQYYGIDLSATPAQDAVPRPVSIDQHIQNRQWGYLRDLGDEWWRSAEANQPFVLSKRSPGLGFSYDTARQALQLLAPSQQPVHLTPAVLSSAAPSHLSNTPPSTSLNLKSIGNDTIEAWLGAAKGGDTTALDSLHALREALDEFFPSTDSRSRPTLPTLPSVSISDDQHRQVMPDTSAPVLHTVNQADDAQPGASSTAVSDADILRACNQDIEALNRAVGMRDWIRQVEDGSVSRMRELYGPKENRDSHAVWVKIKGKITKRERLYNEMVTEFKGDQEAFFQFFTLNEPSNARRKRNSKGKNKEITENLRPCRLVVEAIPRRKKDVEAEKKVPCYLDADGCFSEAVWQEKWGTDNDWEIWRRLAKERYS